jgi:hypothetical protein
MIVAQVVTVVPLTVCAFGVLSEPFASRRTCQGHRASLRASVGRWRVPHLAWLALHLLVQRGSQSAKQRQRHPSGDVDEMERWGRLIRTLVMAPFKVGFGAVFLAPNNRFILNNKNSSYCFMEVKVHGEYNNQGVDCVFIYNEDKGKHIYRRKRTAEAS